MNRTHFPINLRVIGLLLLAVVLISAAAIVTDRVSPRDRTAVTSPLFRQAPATGRAASQG
jgi:hypothetical protein